MFRQLLFAAAPFWAFLFACGAPTGSFLLLDEEAPDDGLTDPDYSDPDDPCDGLDNDVDGVVDEGCYCFAKDAQRCYPGDPDQVGVGVCAWGIQRCQNVRGDFQTGSWTECADAVLPAPEICGNDVDEDCDGYVAPCQDGDITGLPCHPGQSARCYPGPPDTEGVGPCEGGTRQCVEGDVWGPCENAVIPAHEICENGLDEDCDGHDEAC